MPPVMGPVPASTSASTSSSTVTAPIHEFICLFTHDLRRKQKRWEDGRLRYHTFNKRIMVYDERGHLVGDMHWQNDWEFGEGEEFQLDRGAIIVQVSECVGRQEQDLTELLDRRAKEKQQPQPRPAARPNPSSAAPITPRPASRPNEHFLMRHRPLNQLITPTGHHGRAVAPSESPFELRQRETAGDQTNEQPQKKRKREPESKPAFAQHLFGATLTLSAVPVSSAPLPRPTPTYRRQDTSSPPDAGQVVEQPQVSNQQREATGSGGGSAVTGPSKSSHQPSHTSIQDRQVADEVPSVPFRPLGRQVPSLLKTTPRVPVDSETRSTIDSRNPDPPPAISNKSKASRSKAIEKTVPRGVHPRDVPEVEVNPSRDDSNCGTSLSQAIAIDEDDDEESLDPRDSRPQQPEASRMRTDSKATKPSKKKPKRDRVPSPSPPPPPPVTTHRSLPRVEDEEPPPEDRRELRLKPRPKRGLLCLAEEKNRPKQTKSRPAAAEQTGNGRSVGEAMGDVLPKPAVEINSPRVEPPTSPEVASVGSPRASPRPTAKPQEQRISPITDLGFDEDDFDLPMEDIITGPTPNSPKPAPTVSNDGRMSSDLSSSPPPAKRVRSKRRVTAKADAEPSSSEPELPSKEEAEEPALPDSPPKTRTKRTLRERRPAQKTRRAADEESEEDSPPPRRAQKKAKIEDDEESEEEAPPPRPAPPKLARIKKSVRSREVIGFIPSSPPVVAYTSLLRPPPGVGPPNSAGGDGPTALRPSVPEDGVTQEPKNQLPDRDEAVPLRDKTSQTTGPLPDSQGSNSTRGELRPSHKDMRQCTAAERLPNPPSKSDTHPRRKDAGGAVGPDAPTTAAGRVPQKIAENKSASPCTLGEGSFPTGEAAPEIEPLPAATSHDSINIRTRSTRPINDTTTGPPTNVCVTPPAPDNASTAAACQPPPPQQPPALALATAVPARNILPVAASPAAAVSPGSTTPPATSAANATPKTNPTTVTKVTAPITNTTITTTSTTTTNNKTTSAPEPAQQPPQPQPQQEQQQNQPPPAPAPQRPKTIPNPATRGRKAALKSDAMGLVPLPVLPPDPPPMVHHPMLMGGMGMGMGMGSTGRGPAAGEEQRPKRVMRFPGFTSARDGGPWSREAHDLLEKGRPGS